MYEGLNQRNNTPSPKGFKELVGEFNQRPRLFQGRILSMSEEGDYDYYNPSGPFRFEPDGDLYMVERMEHRHIHGSYAVPMVLRNNDIWAPVPEIQWLALEDPRITKIQGKMILSGVETWSAPTPGHPEGTNYKDVFYRIVGNFDSYEKVADGPERFKDTLLIDLPDGRIGVMPRPHLNHKIRGVASWTTVKRIEELTPEKILSARILWNQVPPWNWIGNNQLYPLGGGRQIGVLGHIACEDEEGKHYAAMTFVYDWMNHLYSPIELLATVNCFPPFKSRTPYHRDVIFPSALIFNPKNSLATLIAGLGDANTGVLVTRNPWYLM